MEEMEPLNRLAIINSQISALDNEITRLFGERLLLNEKAGALYAVLDGRGKNFAAYPSFTPLMDQMLSETVDSLPKKATVACQGVEGAFSHQAAEQFFSEANIVFYQQFDDVFRAVQCEEVDYGVLPIENTTAGSVVQVYDLMRRYDFYIVQETKVRISHCLLAKAGTKLAKLKEVYSHPQALNQCSQFFESNQQLKAVEYSNTAAAAQFVAKQSEQTLAAIASHQCAQKYGLSILAENIQDIAHNTTRFICISKRPTFLKNANKISICVTLPHKAGSLCHLLNKFSAVRLNLTKLESRPWPEKLFEFLFYLDIEGTLNDPKARLLMEELANQLGYFKLLGCY